jgi:hypothetical protein
MKKQTITKKEGKILIYSLDILTNIEQDAYDRTKLYNKLYKIAGVKK